MNKLILYIENLSKSYKDIQVLKDFSLEIKDKEFISIIGPSGCGKSTLLSILSNIESYDKGNIIKKENAKIEYMLQNDCLLPWKTVYENCILGLEIKKNLNQTNKQKVLEMINNYGLRDFINSYPNQLSGGMKQRVALIRTLALNPDILLLDEPFSALDFQTRLNLSNDLYKIFEKEEKTIIMVTHDISEAISLSDRIIVLSNRPAKIKKEYKINLTNKKDPIHNRECKEFNKYFNEIWSDLNNE